MSATAALGTIIDAGTHLDALRSPTIRDRADDASLTGEPLVVDVRSVRHMDMAGLSVLAWVLVLSRRRGHVPVLLGPVPAPVARLLDLTKFDRFFDVRHAS